MPESLAEWFTHHMKGRDTPAVAEQLEVSRQTLYAYQSGKLKPTLKRLYRFCELLMLSDSERRAAVDMMALL